MSVLTRSRNSMFSSVNAMMARSKNNILASSRPISMRSMPRTQMWEQPRQPRKAVLVDYMHCLVAYTNTLNRFKHANVTDLSTFWADDIEMTEVNQNTTSTRQRGKKDLLHQFLTSQKVLESQKFELREITPLNVDGNQLCVQMSWQAITGVPMMGRKQGESLKAELSVFLEYNEMGQIKKQKTHTYYHPL